ncbi:Aspartate chemoreceptor protein [Tritonibacter multivorans]|uniref:Aspartate chemoreceptor protein n=1 Tax=Tritonibacter multivorans TaxID=928856 RepID=A0A0P1G5E1_9RHOB|nr:globin-coupled sensor protein [Tritonibacter multivorans]MDA7421773.1 methyl-accepting chemotaxis protein [Tritonibacter multivorans]CUH76907.1 Aspartate chemoreceptor protein [Tritonibacter multivorans]SFD05136.1 methyl-accepting chemotaxis sensory transducer [Tritonibacter multivorans]
MSQEINDLLAKFKLDGGARKDLIAAGKLAAPLLPEVLEHFYAAVTEVPEMVAFFENPAMIARAKAAQQKHWENLLSGRFDAEYFASAAKIGRIHPRIGLPFFFFLSGYALATSEVQRLLVQKHGRFGGQKALATKLSVLTRAFAMDTHLILDAHFEAEQDEQNRAFAHLSEGIDRLAQRDLSTLIPDHNSSDFPEKFDAVRQSFNNAQLSLRKVVAGIQDSSDKLTGIANEVSLAADDLSHRTETQAATLEETAAAVEEITASIRSASEATSATSHTVSQARDQADEGSGVVQTAVQKMSEIEEYSQKIAEIIGVIDDISFQTNLLALNAGVEAARAGESGRGFAVVASEVRALAQRTADSAQEIKGLIGVSTTHVDEGVQLVGSTGDVLASIVKNIQQASALTEEVAQSAAQQATGFEEINIGVSQLDGVTQQNAAMVEQTTAALHTMKKDVATLAELAQSFRVGGGQDTVAHVASPAQPTRAAS